MYSGYIDAHAHLHDGAFDADRNDMFQRALSSGVKSMIFVGTDVEESRKAVTCAEQYSMFSAVGMHPHVFNDISSEQEMQNGIKEIGSLLKHKKVVAIGEIGLDYHSHTNAPITDIQKRFQTAGFNRQMELARRYGMPVIIHCRDAYEDMSEILASMYSDMGIVLHCYQGNADITRKFLSFPNTFFSFAGNITYPVRQSDRGTKNDIREVVRLVPLERILSETDCPYLAPQPVRGSRNEPSYVRYVTEEIAEIHGVAVDDAIKTIEENFQKVFFTMYKNLQV